MSILDGFEVLEVPRTFSIAEVNILKNKISFNMAAASELGYPAFVRIFISHDKTQLALQPCDQTAPNAMKFFTLDESKKRKKTISIGNRALATLVKSSMGWNMSQQISAPGIRFSEENVIIFDLRQAHLRGKKSAAETGMCLVPQPAVPFHQVAAEYFSEEPAIIDVDASVI